MLVYFHPRRIVRQFIKYHQNSAYLALTSNLTTQSLEINNNNNNDDDDNKKKNEVERIIKVINEHPFPDTPLDSTLLHHIPPSNLSPSFIDNVLGRLFASNANGLKAFEFFKFTLRYSNSPPTSHSFHMTLHILTRMRYFHKAWELIEDIIKFDPSFFTLKSMSILLSKIAKYQTYEDTLEAFHRMEKSLLVGTKFGIDEFNVLLRVFCTQRQMKEAKSVFNKMYSRFPPNTKTMNILLLGFKESGDITSVELFYHELVKRGFKPNNVTYNIRIDAYCKKGCLGDGLRLLQEMEHANCVPTLETITTLIHGAGIAKNVTRAWELFNNLPARMLCPDVGAYNAMISVLVKCRQVECAITLMNEMEAKHITPDGITYHTLFHGLMKSSGIEAVRGLYDKMVLQNFVPETRTVVMLMKFFCGNRHVDLGLKFWNYLMEKGSCPHDHALALLVTILCSLGRVHEAFECAKQMLNRGRHIGEPVFHMLDRFLREAGQLEKLRNLDEMIRKLGSVYPQSRGHALGLSASL